MNNFFFAISTIALFPLAITAEALDDSPASSPRSVPPGVIPLDGYREGPEHQGSLLSARFSPDGRRVVTSSRDKTIRIWDGATGKSIAALPGPDEERFPAFDAAFLSQGRWVAACGPWMGSFSNGRRIWSGGILKVWDIESREELFRFASADMFHSLAVSIDEKYLTCFTGNAVLKVISTTEKRRVAVSPTLELAPAQLGQAQAVGHDLGDQTGVSSSGLRAVTTAKDAGGGDGVSFYDAGGGDVQFLSSAELARAVGGGLDAPPGRGVRKASISPDGRRLAVSFLEARHAVHLFDLDSLRFEAVFAMDESESVSRIEFAEDSRLALAAESGRIAIFDAAGGALLMSHGGNDGQPVRAMQFVGEELRVLSGAGARAKDTAGEVRLDPSMLYLWNVPVR